MACHADSVYPAGTGGLSGSGAAGGLVYRPWSQRAFCGLPKQRDVCPESGRAGGDCPPGGSPGRGPGERGGVGPHCRHAGGAGGGGGCHGRYGGGRRGPADQPSGQGGGERRGVDRKHGAAAGDAEGRVPSGALRVPLPLQKGHQPRDRGVPGRRREILLPEGYQLRPGKYRDEAADIPGLRASAL